MSNLQLELIGKEVLNKYLFYQGYGYFSTAQLIRWIEGYPDWHHSTILDLYAADFIRMAAVKSKKRAEMLNWYFSRYGTHTSRVATKSMGLDLPLLRMAVRCQSAIAPQYIPDNYLF